MAAAEYGWARGSSRSCAERQSSKAEEQQSCKAAEQQIRLLLAAC
jgi:hypothetical protein